jgi:hypothetical protein
MSHTFSHRIEVYHPVIFRVPATASVCDVTARWAAHAERDALPLAVAQRRIAAAAGL